MIRSKAFSTFDLLPADEYASGLAQAEAELPRAVSLQLRLAARGCRTLRLRGYRLEWLVLLLVALGTLPLVCVVDAQDTSRLALTESIVLRGHVDIDPYWQLTTDRAFQGGHWYSDKAPGVSLLAVPILEAVRAVDAGRGGASNAPVWNRTWPLWLIRVSSGGLALLA